MQKTKTAKQKKEPALSLSKGFTLIEMLVVIGIIGILSTMLLVSVSRIRKNSIDTRRKANLENVRGAVAMYYSTKSTWPCIGDAQCPALNWTSLISRLSVAGYMSDTVKTDEDSDGKNDYSVCQCGGGCTCNPGAQIKLSARLEVSTNEDCSTISTCPGDITGATTCCSLEVK